jgi:hypothetical protein
MRFSTRVLAAAAMAGALIASSGAFAGKEDDGYDHFVKMCDTDKDGMVSKAEVMKMVEKMFDKHDSKRMGKLDKKQADAFLAELMKGGG